MRFAVLLAVWAGCGVADQSPPAPTVSPDAEVRALAAPCLVRAKATAPVQVLAILGEDGAPTVVSVTGTRDALLTACVARAVKSVRFPDSGTRLEITLGSSPNGGE